jgi:signal transduction histidine kinase
MQTNLHRLASLALDLLPQAVLVTDRSGTILIRNGVASTWLPTGANVSEVLGCPEGRPALVWEAELAAMEEEPTGLAIRNIPLAGRVGRILLADIFLRKLADPRDFDSRANEVGAAAVLIVVEDISARIAMERRQAASERLSATGQVAARVAHELNNPLDGVMRYIGLAQRVAGDAAGPYLAGARAGLKRMADVVTGLLEQCGTGRSVRQKVPVSKLLEEALSSFAPRAGALGVAVACDLADDASEQVDGAVFQVFCNIIKNALDAMPNGGLLAVRLRRRNDRCVVEFTDNGCGMTQQEARRAFEPFFTTKPAGEGTGLGLAICREILTDLGGTITMEPRKEGGVVATVTLPLGEAANGSIASGSANRERG